MALKKLFTTGERAVYSIAQELAAPIGVEALAKVRIADLVEIANSGISNAEYAFALRAHFDVVIVRDNLPILAIEFDGPAHDSKHDHVKNALAERFKLPLVRVDLTHLNSRNFDDTAVHFLVHQLFAVEDFHKEFGENPYEIYDPSFFITAPGKKGSWPFAYPNRWRGRLVNRFKNNYHRFAPDIVDTYKHGLMQFGASEGAWMKDDVVRAFCGQSVGGGKVVVGKADLRIALFGMDEPRRTNYLRVHPFVMGLAASEMHDKAVEFIDGNDAVAQTEDNLSEMTRQWEAEGFRLIIAMNLK